MPASSGPMVIRVICGSSITTFEIFHERHERLNTLAREGIVDRSSNAADRAMSLQPVESLGRCFGRELLFEFLLRQTKRYVHRRTTIGVRMTSIKVSSIDRVIN